MFDVVSSTRFVTSMCSQLCDVILELKDNKHKRVKLAVISLIPNLSERYSDTFIRSHLVRSSTLSCSVYCIIALAIFRTIASIFS